MKGIRKLHNGDYIQYDIVGPISFKEGIQAFWKMIYVSFLYVIVPFAILVGIVYLIVYIFEQLQ